MAEIRGGGRHQHLQDRAGGMPQPVRDRVTEITYVEDLARERAERVVPERRALLVALAILVEGDHSRASLGRAGAAIPLKEPDPDSTTPPREIAGASACVVPDQLVAWSFTDCAEDWPSSLTFAAESVAAP